MNKNRRRLIVGTTVAALAACPFVVRSFRKSKPLPGVMEWYADTDIVPSGRVAVPYQEMTFQPVGLSHKDVLIDSVVACLSSDKKTLLASYCYGGEVKGCLCAAPVGTSALSGKLKILKEYEPWTMVAALGCSSAVGIDRQRISASVRTVLPDNLDERVVNCSDTLYYYDFNNVQQQQPVFELRRKYNKQLFLTDRRLCHCWLQNSDTLIYGNELSLMKFDSRSVLDTDEKIPFRKQGVNKEIEIIDEDGEKQKRFEQVGVLLSSTIFDNGDGTVRFIEAPVTMKKRSKIKAPRRDPYATVAGTLITTDTEGRALDEVPFPGLPIMERALLTKTHWCFLDLASHQNVITAPIEEPKKFTLFRFQEEYFQPDGIQYLFTIHDILSDGVHLLCSRYVAHRFVEQAKNKGLPLCELGIATLPFKIG